MRAKAIKCPKCGHAQGDGEEMMNKNVDVVAVSVEDSSVLWIMENHDGADAEAIIRMAVVSRQGCDDRFFTTAPLGKFKTGDKYENEVREAQ